MPFRFRRRETADVVSAAGQDLNGYESRGDVVTCPFQGDWFDAARIYRKWAVNGAVVRQGAAQLDLGGQS